MAEQRQGQLAAPFEEKHDVAAIRRGLGVAEGAPLACCIARLEPVKNHAGLLAAWRKIADIWPGDSSDPSEFTVANGRLFFAASDAQHGRELWAIGPAAPVLLLRNDDVTVLDPHTPPKASLLPLDATRDAYLEAAPGMVDPEMTVHQDAARPLAYYALDGAATLRLTKTGLGRIRIDF